MTTYIIEHLEPQVYKWCLMEYKNISKIVGKENLWFTNIKRKNKNLEIIGKVFKSSVTTMNLDNSCILDPESSKQLTPREAKSFNYFIFGGILGDYPPRKRTTPELTSKMSGVESRNIGKAQFSTDNAILVTKEIVSGVPLEKIKFQDTLTIEINEVESVDLPYSYPIINGKPQISDELVKFLKKKKGF